MAEWSKAVAQGAIPSGRGFQLHTVNLLVQAELLFDGKVLLLGCSDISAAGN